MLVVKTKFAKASNRGSIPGSGRSPREGNGNPLQYSCLEKFHRARWAMVLEDKMVGWHHPLNGHEFEQAPGDGEGQGSLVCFSPWGCKGFGYN